MKVTLEKICAEITNRDIKHDGEEYCFMFATDFYHLLSLLWSKTTRKTTPEFCTYKLREVVKTVCKLSYVSGIDFNELEIQLNKDITTVERLYSETADEIILAHGIGINGNDSTDIVMKLATLIVLISKEFNLFWSDIEDYTGTKN